MNARCSGDAARARVASAASADTIASVAERREQVSTGEALHFSMIWEAEVYAGAPDLTSL